MTLFSFYYPPCALVCVAWSTKADDGRNNEHVGNISPNFVGAVTEIQKAVEARDMVVSPENHISLVADMPACITPV